MNKICFAISSILLVSVILSSPSIKAAPVDQNIQAATEAYKKGSYADAARLFATAAEDLAKAKNPQAALLWGNAALAMLKGEDYQAAADIYEKLLNIKQQIPQDKLLQFYINSIVCYTKLKQPAMRIASIDALLKKFPKLKAEDLAELYASQGDAYFNMELYAPAITCYEKAMAKLPANANPEMRMRIVGALGECQRTLGYYADAKKTLSEAEKAAEKLKDPKILAENKSKLGVLHTEIGDYPEALKRLNDALATEQKAGLRLHEGSENNNIGQVYLYTGNHEKAMDHFEKGISIAREVGNKKGQAIATINRALLKRIAGSHVEAKADYKEGAKLFQECGLKEGQAVTMLGIGKMAEMADKNNIEALQNYEQALEIFIQLQQPRWQAVTLLQLGEVYKKMKSSGRSTRDLVFEEEPTNPDISEADVLEKSRAYFEQALKIGEQLGAEEIIWAAHQGLGFSDYNAGNLESALEHYQKAINIVSNMFLNLQDVQMLGEYMAGKEDLYNEAIEVCAKLYDKTKDKKYLDTITRYKQTLNNEINKANTALVQLNFEDKEQQKLYERFKELGKIKNRISKMMPVTREVASDATIAEEQANVLIKKIADEQKLQIQKLDAEYSKLLKEWQEKYPQNADIFTSSTKRINIHEIQKMLSPNQAVIQYIPLKGNEKEAARLLIIGIKKNTTESFSVNIGEKELRKLILDEFVVGYIHNGFKRYIRDEKTGTFARDSKGKLIMGDVNFNSKKYNEEYFNKSIDILSRLYTCILPEQVQEFLSGVERIYFMVDGFLSQIPFNMLVCGREADGLPIFLIEKYQISTIRPSFLENVVAAKDSGGFKKMLAVANPRNENFPMAFLDGSIEEVKTANNLLPTSASNKDIALEHLLGSIFKPHDVTSLVSEYFPNEPEIIKTKPTEKWLRENLENNKYEIIYFATHGQAQSDTVTKIEDQVRLANDAQDVTTRKKAEKILHGRQQKAAKIMREKNLSELTPLNGFLYLSNLPEDQILDNNLNPTNAVIPKKRDGLLTIGEILELDKKKFDKTKLVLLSACNAAVSLVPFAIGEEYDQTVFFDPDTVKKDMAKYGFLDGVDQVTFVESFMKKGVPNVYASYWQLDDTAAKAIMNQFWSSVAAQKDKPDVIKAYSEAQKNYLAEAKMKMRKTNSLDDMHPYYWAAGAMFGK